MPSSSTKWSSQILSYRVRGAEDDDDAKAARGGVKKDRGRAAGIKADICETKIAARKPCRNLMVGLRLFCASKAKDAISKRVQQRAMVTTKESKRTNGTTEEDLDVCVGEKEWLKLQAKHRPDAHKIIMCRAQASARRGICCA